MNNSISSTAVQYLQLKINQVLLSLETNQVKGFYKGQTHGSEVNLRD